MTRRLISIHTAQDMQRNAEAKFRQAVFKFDARPTLALAMDIHNLMLKRINCMNATPEVIDHRHTGKVWVSS